MSEIDFQYQGDTVKDETDIFMKLLKAQNLKLTKQRKYVLDVFLKTERHVSVDDMYDIVKKRQPQLGYATVFRTLKLLCQCGLATPVYFGDKRIRYEHKYGHKKHIHLICRECGSVIESVSADIENIKNKMCKSNDFIPDSYSVDIFGICKKCITKS